MVSRGQTWSAEVRHGQLGAGKVCCNQPRLGMVSRGQAGSAKSRQGLLQSAKVRHGQPRSGKEHILSSKYHSILAVC